MAENNFKKCEAPVGDAELDALAEMAAILCLPISGRTTKSATAASPSALGGTVLDEFPPLHGERVLCRGQRTAHGGIAAAQAA